LQAAPLPTPAFFSAPEKLPLIYVVGPPRSGTTLLSQLIARCLPVGYINNLIARFWLRPSVGIYLSKSFFTEESRSEIPLHSAHGTTNGIFSPHEFGYFWRQWLRLDEASTHHLPAEHLMRLDKQGLKDAIEKEILAPFHGPVALKNVICGFQASFLTELHPCSLFIYVERDLYSTAASILKVRKERFGNYNVWWSLKPSTYPFPEGMDAAEQVVHQVLDCKKEFKTALNRPGVRTIFTTYDTLISKPLNVLSEISKAVTDLGWPIKVLEENLPSLARARPTVLPAEWHERLRYAIEKTQSDLLEKT
jgi:LPS sulfotransferase NodH